MGVDERSDNGRSVDHQPRLSRLSSLHLVLAAHHAGSTVTFGKLEVFLRQG